MKVTFNEAVRCVSTKESSSNTKNTAPVRSNEEENNGVAINISEEGMELLNAQEKGEADSSLEDESNKPENILVSLEEYRKRLEAGKDAADATENIGKMLEIARRISRGDKVPRVDEQKLMEYSPKLYQLAKSAAMLNEAKEHKEYKKSLFEEEENSLEKKLRELEREESGQPDSGTDSVLAEAAEAESTESSDAAEIIEIS